ncbi:MAG TPA: arylamine N-acetyltransferase [Actinophytocola sp.]|uniref:arylamine N-acetyltransferase family protein n=1 Tax=Actinophytocola sp. TaxID=1872138 RepID=UPI002DB57BF1|nr:arylamine N-acetyltransferase [Actinophytocola sp.]HEU5473552.1 arylamine N-acetyltransferase [Actinophytocola sp.]
MDTASYLRRIGCRAVPGTPVRALRELHRRHLMSVPFENLDVLHRIPLGDSSASLLDKVVSRSRGGLCFELNRTFDWLLTELGFRVTLIGAEIADGDGYFPDIHHPVLLVEAGPRTWLADVGWGPISFPEPLRLDDAAPQRQSGVDFRVTDDGGNPLVSHRVGRGAWQRMFRLLPTPRRWPDFDHVRAFHQTSPESPYTRKLVCYKAIGVGEHALLAGRRLTVVRNGATTETELDDDRDHDTALTWILHGWGQPQMFALNRKERHVAAAAARHTRT